jgi:hypothetical protein
MLEFSWRLVGRDGEIRLHERLGPSASPNLWRVLASVARTFGQQGEILQVLDERDEIVIHVGVATAQSAGYA